MSANLEQIYVANPVSIINVNDLLYIGQHGTTDAAIRGSDFLGLFAPAAGSINITTLGTITTGTWQGTILSPTFGGTGNNNGSSKLVLAGNLGTVGAFPAVLTFTAPTIVTVPTSGTLATTSQLPTPAALTEVDDTNVTMTLGGTPATSLLQAVSMTLGWTGQLSPARGGTGVNNGTSTINLGTPTSGFVLTSDSSGNATWQGTNLTGAVLLAPSATQTITGGYSLVVQGGSHGPGNIQVIGGSLVAGSPTLGGDIFAYSFTPNNGYLAIQANANSAGNFSTVLSTANPIAQAQFVYIPDVGASGVGTFLMTNVAGNLQTISSSLQLSSGTLGVSSGIVSSGLAAGGFSGEFTAYATGSSLGSISLLAANNAGNFANILTHSSTSAARTWTLPDASGTIALTGGSTLSTLTGDSGTATASGGSIAIHATTNAGSTIRFVGSGATLNLNVTSAITNNTIIGSGSGNSGITGVGNTSLGKSNFTALTTGDANYAFSTNGLNQLTTGSFNLAFGSSSGTNYTSSESSNILFNHSGVVGENNTLRIGTATGTGFGQLNTAIIYGINGITNSNAVLMTINSSTSQLGTVPSVNGAVLATNGVGIPSLVALTAGQILIGTTAGIPVANQISSGTNITVTNASGGITVGLSGIVAPILGGTGINNGSNTLTLGGSLTTSGAFASTFTMTGATSVTFPTSGTLATIADISSSGVLLAPSGDQSITGGFNLILSAGGNFIAGQSGSAGAFISYAPVTSAGTLTLAATTNTFGSFGTILTNVASIGQNQIIALPDAGTGAAVNVILSSTALPQRTTNLVQGFNPITTSGATTTLTASSAYEQYYTGSGGTDVMIMPVTSTLIAGQPFKILNESTNTILVESSNTSPIQTLIPDSQIELTCVSTAGAGTPAEWQWIYTIFSPPDSASSSLTLGTAYQNNFGYDILLTVYLDITAASGGSILAGVGSTSTVLTQVVVTAFSGAGLVTVPLFIPDGYYGYINGSGTITVSISGQQAMAA